MPAVLLQTQMEIFIAMEALDVNVVSLPQNAVYIAWEYGAVHLMRPYMHKTFIALDTVPVGIWIFTVTVN